MDGSKTVGMIKNGCIYDRNIASSSYILAMTKNNVIYNRNIASSSYCIGMVKNGPFTTRILQVLPIRLAQQEMLRE